MIFGLADGRRLPAAPKSGLSLSRSTLHVSLLEPFSPESLKLKGLNQKLEILSYTH